jgi:N-acetylglutamate synthase-like GNAT family acetyltransferase
MNIRRAMKEDAAEACAFIRASIAELCYADDEGDQRFLDAWLSNKTTENMERRIATSYFYVAEEDGKILGVAAMLPSGRVTVNYVAPSARFRGVSKALVLTLEEEAESQQIQFCTLESSRTALQFYQKLGYIDTGETYVLSLTGNAAIVLSKRLS